MGEAKRRRTFEQRKAQRLSKQFGLTNAELEEAYRMNWMYNRKRRMQNRSSEYKQLTDTLFNYQYMFR
jgi:hypothetical protein